MNILFLCAANVFRSQMAESIFNTFTNSQAHIAKSAGLTKPREKMHALVIKAMLEEHIDINNNISKPATQELINWADLIILMHKDLEQPLKEKFTITKPIEIWNIPDIIAKETDLNLLPDFIKTKNLIKQQILELLTKLK